MATKKRKSKVPPTPPWEYKIVQKIDEKEFKKRFLDSEKKPKLIWSSREDLYELFLKNVQKRIKDKKAGVLSDKKSDNMFNLFIVSNAILNYEYRAYMLKYYNPKKYKPQTIDCFFEGFLKALKKCDYFKPNKETNQLLANQERIEKYKVIVLEECENLIEAIKES